MKKLVALLLVLAMCFSLAACTKSGNQDSKKITVTDLDGKTYSFDKPLDKVVIASSGSGGPFFVLSAFWGKDFSKHVVAMDNGLAENRNDMYQQFIKDDPALDTIPKLGDVRRDDYDIETGLSVGGEAFIIPIGMKASISETVQLKYEAAGIPVIYIDYHSETIENHTKSTELLGKLFGQEAKAKELIDFYVSRVEDVDKRIAKLLETNPRPTIYNEVCSGGPSKMGNCTANDTLWGAMGYRAGGTSIAEGVYVGTGQLDPEYVLTANPDLILFAGSYWPKQAEAIQIGYAATEESVKAQVENYLTRAGWSELNAVKNNRICVISHAVAREIFDCSSLQAVAKAVWPEEFSDLNPTATLKEFFDTFLPYGFSGTWYYEYTGK